MAGHSKWDNIKHRKGRQDEKRQKVFSKLIRELTVAAKLGGPEPGDNPRLRLALDKALGANMPKDTIEGEQLVREIAPVILKKINKVRIPLMIKLIKAILKNKKLNI